MSPSPPPPPPPIGCRKVVEHGLYMKHCKVEVYLLEFKLSLHSRQNDVITKQFSRASSVGEYKCTSHKSSMMS
jgi:hypothetical protein